MATFPRHFFSSFFLLRARAFHTIISASSSPTVFARRGGARGGVVVVLSAFTKLCWCHAARPPRRAARCKWSAGGLTFYHKTTTTTTTTGFSERRRRGGRSAAAVVASSSANDNDSYNNDSFYEEDLERLRQTVENERKMNIETTSSEMRSKREEEPEDLSSEEAEAKAFKNPLLSQDDLMPPRSDSPAIDISFAHGFDSHHSLTSVQEVYTNLAILDAAHQSMNFLDSKDFVDTEIRSSASVTISNFLNIGNNREGTIGSGRGEESTSVGAGSAAAAGTSGMGQIMERESKTDEDVMKQFFEGHFFEGPSGLNDIGGSGNRGGGEEGTVANELVNLLNDWTEMPSVIAKLFIQKY